MDVSANNILITNEQMYATRDEITEYFRNDLLRDNPSGDRNKQITNVKSKRKKEPIQDKRLRLFETFCQKVAKEKNLPDDKHQTVYDSYQPPMTIDDFYDELTKFDSNTYSFNAKDFVRDKTKVKIKFSKAARSRE